MGTTDTSQTLTDQDGLLTWRLEKVTKVLEKIKQASTAVLSSAITVLVMIPGEQGESVLKKVLEVLIQVLP